MQASPICFITCETLLADDPAAKIAKNNRKFPAQIFVPAISCCVRNTINFGCLRILSVISSLDKRKTPYIPILLKLSEGSHCANNVHFYVGKHHIHTVLFVLISAGFKKL